MVPWIRLAAVLALCVWIGACQRVPDLSRLGAPAQRLVGHWTASDGHDEYFGKPDARGTGELTSLRAGGQPSQHRYRVLGEDSRTQSVRIALLDDQDHAGTSQTIVISEDGESAVVTQATSTSALARVDDATTPRQSHYIIQPVPASTAPVHVAGAMGPVYRLPPANPPPFAPPANAPDGQYRYVLVGYDGLTPLYAWKRVTDVEGRHVDDTAVVYSRGLARRHNYAVWLHTVAFAILLVTTLLFRKEIDTSILLVGWGTAIAICVLGVFVLNATIIAGILEIFIGFVLLVRGLFPKSDMLA